MLMHAHEARGGGKRALGPSSLNSMPSRSVKSSPPSHRSMNMLHVQADSRTWKETATYMLQSDANIHALKTPTRPTNTYTPTCKQTGRTRHRGGNLVEVHDILVVDFAEDLNFPGKALHEDGVIRRYADYFDC